MLVVPEPITPRRSAPCHERSLGRHAVRGFVRQAIIQASTRMPPRNIPYVARTATTSRCCTRTGREANGMGRDRKRVFFLYLIHLPCRCECSSLWNEEETSAVARESHAGRRTTSPKQIWASDRGTSVPPSGPVRRGGSPAWSSSRRASYWRRRPRRAVRTRQIFDLADPPAKLATDTNVRVG